jgi:hypothetical protein
MKILLLLLMLVSLHAGAQTGNPKKAAPLFTITGSVEKHSEYCSGVEPPDGNTSPTITAFAGLKLYIRNDTVNASKKIVMEFTTDEQGNFSIQLPPGNYCIIPGEKVKPLDLAYFRKLQKTEITSEDCLKQWWRSCHATLSIRDTNIDNLRIVFFVPCTASGNPCLIYTGDPPP